MNASATGDESEHRRVFESVHRFGTDRINWDVLEGPNGVTIVDAGLPGHRP